jgi:hypothetical protein
MSQQAIESLAHFAGKPSELQMLRDRVQELEEVLGITTKELALQKLPLSPQCCAILACSIEPSLWGESRFIPEFGVPGPSAISRV